MGKEGPFLDVVVADELEVAALGKNGSFLVDGAVFKTEKQMRGNLIAADNLDEISNTEDLAFFASQREIAV
jgi:hypothetical protein